MQDFVGKQIDHYRITERLDIGGWTVLCKAYSTRLDREVAIKLIPKMSISPERYKNTMKHFVGEVKDQAHFSHPHIVPIYDYGTWEGEFYLVLKYIPGGTLKDRMGQPVSLEQALTWLIPVADALAYAHQKGVIHQDVKPSNILFDHDDQPLLADFGIAKVWDPKTIKFGETVPGLGTPDYMAVEQWHGKVCEASDQFALGTVLYELITRQKPFSIMQDPDSPNYIRALMLQKETQSLVSPSMLVGGIPEVAEEVILKAVSRDPKDRYRDMNTLHRVLVTLVESFQREPADGDAGLGKLNG